jgi:hypothetical protein
MKCKCEVEIPAARIALGYRVCVACSQEQPVSCVDIIYHKTGNTIQQCTKEQADAIRKASRRSGFGAAAGMRAGSEPKPKVTLTRRPMPALARVVTREDIEALGREALSVLETEGEPAMQKFLSRACTLYQCTPVQASRIAAACSALINMNSIKQ